MNNQYADLDERTTHCKDTIDSHRSFKHGKFAPIHPEDAVTFYNNIASHATEKAAEQAAINDRDGIPER